MRISPTSVEGVMLVDLSPHADERGGFARAFCAEIFAAHGLADCYPQANLSWNDRKGTLRGLHYQIEPKAEDKLVRATRGRVYDVAVDLRPSSPSYRGWTAVVLDAAQRNAIYIPRGCAHGYLTLEDECEVLYLVSEPYAPDLARDLRWDDPALKIAWPFAPLVMSAKDATAPCLDRPAAG